MNTKYNNYSYFIDFSNEIIFTQKESPSSRTGSPKMKKLFLSYEQKVLFEIQHDLGMPIGFVRGIIGNTAYTAFGDILRRQTPFDQLRSDIIGS